jgi:hypothetical protein
MLALVAIAALGMWLTTQVGMETAEIEILQFDTWPRTTVDETDSPLEVVNVKFRYVQPEELSNTKLILFFDGAAYTDTKNIEIGTRIKFRYRAREVMWLKPSKPDPIAIRSLGLDASEIEEIVTEVNLRSED